MPVQRGRVTVRFVRREIVRERGSSEQERGAERRRRHQTYNLERDDRRGGGRQVWRHLPSQGSRKHGNYRETDDVQ